ncbi:MAG: hypothetical protein GF353_25995 [Candidatus Lokiarchaeota archaeon]|nr:hypothetical protein [Candidatus Lokiarchaeota archaeon]
MIRGKSPYFSIKKNGDNNFQKITATEVQSIVSDLNYNPDNHFAFVSQGKIDAIKSLKSTDLCNFLEEGIGLKGLREEILQQKKTVSELQTEFNSLKTKQNTLNMNLEFLRPKLEKWEEKKKLLKTREKYEDELLWANKRKLTEEIKNQEREFLRLKVKLDELKKKKIHIENKIDKLTSREANIDDRINEISKKLGEKNYQKQELINKIQKWQQQKIRFKNDLEKLKQKIEIQETNVNNYKNQKENHEKKIKGIEEEKKKIEDIIDDLIKEQTRLLKKIDKNEHFFEEYNSILNKKEDIKREIKAKKQNVENINTEIEQLFQSFRDIEHKFEKNKWFLENPTKNLLAELDVKLRKLRRKQYTIQNEIEKFEYQKVKKIRKLKPLRASLRERRVILPTQITILKEEVKKRNLNIKGPIIDYLQYDDDLSYAIESVLGEKLLYSFVAGDWDTLNILKRLIKKYNAYCNSYVPKNIKPSSFPRISGEGVLGYLADLVKIKDNDQDIKKVILSKIKNCLVVKDFLSGKNMHRKNNFKGKCVTLKGEQIVSYKYVFETPYLKKLKGLLSPGTQEEQANLLESELESINDRILEHKVQLSKLDELQREIFNRKQAFDDLLYSFNQKQRLTTKKNELYETRKEIEEKITDLEEEVTQLDNRLNELKEQKDPEFFKWNKRIKQIPNKLNHINSEKKEWESQFNNLKAIITEIDKKLSSEKEGLNLQKLEFQRKSEEFRKSDQNAFKIYRELENVEDEIINLEKEKTNLKNKKSDLNEEKTKLDKAYIGLNIQYEQENIRLNTTKQIFEEKKRDLERIESRIGPLVSKNEFDIRSIEEIELDIKDIDKTLIEYLDVDESIIVERDHIVSELKGIAKNKKNLNNDIQAAIKAENKMENTYNDKFQKLLDELQEKINQKFEASQIKTYCSFELIGSFEELGVRIRAAISKDQLKSCTALSGGQVSMISICLILSLQELKPSPLCMFDEAAMFLDDKNSEHAYQMIKSTLEENSYIQLIMFLPKSSNKLYLLADKLIGVARSGKEEVSTIFKPVIVKKNKYRE